MPNAKYQMQHCIGCGKELGEYYLPAGEYDHCGNQECADAYNAQLDAERAERREAAERDDYERYR